MPAGKHRCSTTHTHVCVCHHTQHTHEHVIFQHNNNSSLYKGVQVWQQVKTHLMKLQVRVGRLCVLPTWRRPVYTITLVYMCSKLTVLFQTCFICVLIVQFPSIRQ